MPQNFKPEALARKSGILNHERHEASEKRIQIFAARIAKRAKRGER
jgi:hypothetical protein